MISPAGINLIKKHEKCRLKWYLPTPQDKPTCGWGHMDPAGVIGQPITQQQADEFLEHDLAHFDECVAEQCPEATEEQHAAMCCLAYNIGCGAFAKSSVARLHNAGRYSEAAQAFALWNKQAGKVLLELVHRRAEEAALYASGTIIPDEAKVEAGGQAMGEKPLAKSRTIISTATAGLGTAASLASQIRDQAAIVRETSDGLHDTISDGWHVWEMLGGNMGYVAIALIVIGLAGVAYARWSEKHTGRN